MRPATIFIMTLGLAAAARAVTVVGSVPATGDKAADRAAALADARRRAVEEAVGVLVDSNVRLENQLLIRDVIKTRAAGLVKNERVDGEGEAAGLYELTLNCDVEPVPLEDLLNNLRKSVIVRVTEIGPGIDEGRAVEGVIRGKLTEARFKCLDERFMKASGLDEKAAAAGTLAPDELGAMGRRYLAQILIYGEAKAADAGVVASDLPYAPDNPLAGMHIARATANIKAVDTATGRVLAEKQAGPEEFVGFGDTVEAAAADALSRLAGGYAAYFATALAPEE